MKIFGHPLHIILIHLPSGLLPMDFVCSFLQYYTGNASFGQAAFYALCGAVAGGWLAACFGLLDLGKISPGERKTQNVALIHGGINAVMLIVYTILAYKGWKYYPDAVTAGIGTVVLKAILLVLLICGNHFGGNLILKHGVGVEKRA